MTVIPYDIKLGGNQYLLVPGQYQMVESPKSYPTTGGASADEFKHGDNWIYWGQSDFTGDNVDDWYTDGPFNYAYGIDLDVQGQFRVAKALGQTQADATNLGHVPVTIGTTRICFLGKTDGKMYYSTDGASWSVKNLGDVNYLSASNFARTADSLKGSYYVSTATGKLWSTTDGLTWTDKGTGGPTTDAYILGSYKGKLYVGYANALYTYDGTTWTAIFAGLIDGTPTIGVVASSVLYFLTAGPQSKLYMTDSNQLHQLGTISSRFLPYAMKALDAVYVFGKSDDAANSMGEVKRISQTGIETIYQHGDDTADYGIRSAIQDGDKILWGASHITGLGVYDPKLDLYQDVQTGFYVSSTNTGVTGIIDGIANWNGNYYAAIQGAGIYKTTTPGTFKIQSTLFDGNAKNINKLWGFAELNHTALATGQTITLKTSKDAFANSTTWGTSSTLAATSKVINAPAGHKNPYLQWELSGDANGSALAVTSIVLAYVEMSDNPKREWSFEIDVSGDDDIPQEMRDGSDNTRSGKTMLGELNGMWNTTQTFEDLDGTSYTVVVKHPAATADDFIRQEDTSNTLTGLVLRYRLHLTEL